MFFILSKTVYFLLMPLTGILFLFLYAVFSRKQVRKKRCLIAGIALLLFFSNDFIVNEAFLAWEKEPVPLASLERHPVAVVLTGVTNVGKQSNDRVYFNKGADRVLQTVQLYHAGKISRIVISGGSGKLTGEKTDEAAQLKQVFLYCGIPATALITENQSRNTHENARFTGRVIDDYGLKSPVLLITSAFHMKRAEACFRKEGVKVDAFPVDYYSHDRNFTIRSLVPTAEAFYKWSVLVREITGYIAYKFMGYC